MIVTKNKPRSVVGFFFFHKRLQEQVVGEKPVQGDQCDKEYFQQHPLPYYLETRECVCANQVRTEDVLGSRTVKQNS